MLTPTAKAGGPTHYELLDRIGQQVSLMLAETERQGMRRLSTTQGALTRAAAREGPESVVRRLAGLLTGWTVLIDPAGRRVATGGAAPQDDELARLAERVRAPKGPSAATAHRAGHQLIAHALRGTTPGPRAVLVAGRTSFLPADRAVLSVGVALLSLLGASAHSWSRELTAGLLGLAMDGIDSAELLAQALNTAPDATWRVVRARRVRGSSSLTTAAAAFGTPLVASPRDGGVLVVLPDGVETPQGWLMGVSAPVPLAELRFAAARASRLFAEAVVEGRSRVDGSRDSTVDSLVVEEEARAFASRSLRPVVEAGLLETLRAWLANHGSWEAAADALEVHRNTVRHRLVRIAELLDRDLADPDTRAELWLALRWLRD